MTGGTVAAATTPLQACVLGFGDVVRSARADLDRRAWSVFLNIAACRIAREFADLLDDEERAA
jgi:hypothetical protein